MIQYQVQNEIGPYFQKAKFDTLKSFLEICNGFSAMNVKEAILNYDSIEDFHYLTFSVNGHSVQIKYYKVFSTTIDGEEYWTGCPITHMMQLAKGIHDKTLTCQSSPEQE